MELEDHQVSIPGDPQDQYGDRALLGTGMNQDEEGGFPLREELPEGETSVKQNHKLARLTS